MSKRFAIFLFIAAMAFTRAPAQPTVNLGQPGNLPASERPTVRDSVEILYVPRQDLPRVPGYAAEGITLPLGDLTALVRAAESPDAATSRPLSLVCRGLTLRGQVEGSALKLAGDIEYEAIDPGWAASRIDDGTIGWTSQQAPAGAQAFLVRVNGRTMLLAHGPAKGRLAVAGLVPVETVSGSPSLFFGRISAPCRLELGLGARFMPGNSNSPSKSQVSDSGSSVTLWPVQGEPMRLELKQRPALAGSAPMRLELDRRVQVEGAGIMVHDRLNLAGRFSPNQELRLDVPRGLKPLRAGAGADASAALEETGGRNQLRIRWNSESTSTALTIDSVAPLTGAAATLGDWKGPWDAESSKLELVASDKFVPVPELGPEMIPTGGGRSRRAYQAWGPMPAMNVQLVAASPSLPPSIAESLDIRSNEASLTVQISIADSRRNAYSIELPQGWVPIEFGARRASNPIPLSIQQGDGQTWRASWDPANAPDMLSLRLHRVGAWGAPGTTANMALPLIGIDGPRPARHELAIQWPDSIDVQPVSMAGVKVVPNPSGKGEPTRLTLRVITPNPSGALTLSGREPNIRATVLTVLAIEEDRPRVRAQVTYDVSLAPAHTFRILLPAGTGGAVRIQDGAIRETIRRETAQGDEWTVTTQHDVLGRYSLRLEWALDQRPGAKIEAPQIRVPGVASQEGFIVLEGSETLRLGIESANLVETDMGEVPPMPWPRRNRTLAAFRYVAPPFTLRVKAEKFTPGKAPAGLVHEARLVTTVAADGWRLTEANYNYAARGDGQYFDARLPAKAAVWSVRVDGQGVYPARRGDTTGQWLMVPLDSSAATQPRSANSSVSILYSEPGEPLARSTNLELAGPKLPQPVLRTQWELNLPPQFEYLAYGGTLINTTVTRQPLATFMRTAYYPRRILFPAMPFAAIVIITIAGVLGFLIIRAGLKHKPKPVATESAQPAISCMGIIIVVVIIAILAAISVPNFLEAQTRSRVSRAQADLRSVAVAIESYKVDNGMYPKKFDVLWQGNVHYLSSQPADPYSAQEGKGARAYYYAQGIDAWKKLTQAGINVGPPTEDLWLVWTVGPDGRNDNAMVTYDPTNGTMSAGDVFRFGSGSEQAQAMSRTPTLSGGDMAIYSLDNGQKQKEDAHPAPADEPAPSAAAPAAPQPSQHVWSYSESGAAQSNRALAKPDISNLLSPGGKPAPATAMAAGVLSMKIEIPVGGVQRSFEALGAEGNIRLRLMDHDRFRHLSFIVWMAAFLAMGAVWARRRPAYKRVFVLACAFFLIVPVLIGGPWVVFFNRALQGVLFSLAVPLAAKAWNGIIRHNHAVATTIMLGLVVSFAAIPARAAETVRILVPYDEQGPDLTGNPSAFMSREDFSRLWAAADRPGSQGLPGRPVITRLDMDGKLDPATGMISGTLRIFAVNSGDAAGTAALAMAEARLENVTVSGSGASFTAGPNGLVIGLAAHWAGSIEAQLKLPCTSRGVEGELGLTWPEVGSGAWRIQLPFVGVTANGNGVIARPAADGTELSGAIRPGRFEVAWRGAPIRAAARTSQGWRIGIETTLRWDDLAAARWRSRLFLESIGADGRLPQEARFMLPPGLMLSSAEGEALTSADVSSRTLTLHLGDAASAAIELGGLLLPGDSKWQAGGPRPLDGVDAKESVRFEIADAIDLAAIEPAGLRRVPTRAMGLGSIAQQYEAAETAWSARLELRRRPTLFDERTVLWLYPADGIIDEKALVTLKPAGGALHECRIELPAGAKATELKGASVAGWVQSGRSVLVGFDPPVEGETKILVSAMADLPTTGSEFAIEAVRVSGARQSRHWAVVQVETDEDLADLDLAGSRPRPPAEIAGDLELLNPCWSQLQDRLRAYELVGDRPPRLGRSAAQASARVTTLNRVTISNGLRSLLSIVRMEPRRGRVSRFETLLLLDGPDPGASQRIQSSGPIRHVSFEPEGSNALRAIIELDAPHADPVEVRFELDQPVSTEAGTSVGLTAMIPTGEGDRAFVLLRRAFEGELEVTEAAGSRRMDTTEAPWPAQGFKALPADQALELAPAKRATPRMRVVRHARTEALRAVVDTLRQRTILTADGIERHELEIVLQNQSEQFLRVELPYPRAKIDIYEVQSAGRVVRPIFEPGSDSVLLVPLIRTGLLVPELTVNIAYVARTGEELRRKGERGFNLPRVLGGVPVLQSSLVLMLPADYRYSDFKGSLERVELLDLEVDETLRRQRRLEQVSAAALYTAGDAQDEVLSNLGKLQIEANQQLQDVIASNEAYVRRAGEIKGEAGRDEEKIERDKLIRERGENIRKAEIINKAFTSNVIMNQQQMAQQQLQKPRPTRPAPTPTPAVTAAPLKFAQMGEVFAFRKLQGGGDLRLEYAAREISDQRANIAFALLLVAIIAALAYGSGWLLATPRRIIMLALAACLIAIAARAALDLTIPAAAACMLALWLAARRKVKQAGELDS